MPIKKNYVVAKRNVLNEIRANNMTLQELRFFSIYLSKINPKDTSTRVVRFSITDFQKIMELGRVNINYLSLVADNLLAKTVKVPTESGGLEVFQIFKKFRIDLDNNEELYIEIDAHDDALPLMFEFKDKYFTYQLWNALRLRSSNQLRMYEILKQYENIGVRIISVGELKELLGLDIKEYPRYTDFKIHVLDVCKEALEANTDIKFTHEPTGKKGNGGKILYLKFIIQKNPNYVDKLTLDEFITKQPEPDAYEDIENKYKNRLNFVAGACNDEFTVAEIQVLYNIAQQTMNCTEFADDIKLFHAFKNKYDEMVMRAEKSKIGNRFAYIKALFDAELNV